MVLENTYDLNKELTDFFGQPENMRTGFVIDSFGAIFDNEGNRTGWCFGGCLGTKLMNQIGNFVGLRGGCQIFTVGGKRTDYIIGGTLGHEIMYFPDNNREKY